MKVIGKAEDYYIVQVHESELAPIIGCKSNYDADFRNIVNSSLKGADIKVSKIYQNYCKVKSISSSNKYDLARTKLEEMLEALTPLEELVNKMTEEYEADKA